MTTLTPATNDLPRQNPQGGVAPNAPATGDPAGPGLNWQAAMLPLVLLVIAAFFTIISPNHVFLGARNLSMLAIELSITAVLALGMLLVILPGHIDLSAGSGVGLIGGVAAVLVNQGIDQTFLGVHIHMSPWPAWLALLFATVFGVLLWWGMGAVIVKQRVPAFIITLGGLLVFRGLQWKVIYNSTIPVVGSGGEANIFSELTTYYLPPAAGLVLAGILAVAWVLAALASYRRLRKSGVAVDGEMLALRTFIGCQVLLLFVMVCNGYQGVPLTAVILGVVALLTHALTRHTPYGRYLYAIGGNEEAAVVSGVPVAKVVIGAFVLMGLLTAITGFLQTAYAGASTTTVGTLMELDAVAACVIGGVSLRGGRGTVGGVLLGSLIMATLLNGMTLMAYSPEAKQIIRGLILALAVWVDVRLAKR